MFANMRPHFGAPLTDNSKVIIYNCNMFIIEATSLMFASKARAYAPLNILEDDKMILG
jgi:hypothetical protein